MSASNKHKGHNSFASYFILFFFFSLSDREAFATEIPPRLRGHDLKAAKSQLFPAADSKKLEEINLVLTYDLPIC